MISATATGPVRAYLFFTSLMLMAAGGDTASAYTPVYGGPTFTAGVGGHLDVFAVDVNSSGVAIASGYKVDAGGNNVAREAIRFSEGGFEVLGNLGAPALNDAPRAINDLGVIVGRADKFSSTGQSQGARAVKWTPVGTAAVELAHLGTHASGSTNSAALDINELGFAVGNAQRWTGPYNGFTAVRWDVSGSVIELEPLAMTGGVFNSATSINDGFEAVGFATSLEVGPTGRITRAVRWNFDGEATVLDNPPSSTGGFTDTRASEINISGVAIGNARALSATFDLVEAKAVRWGAAGTAAVELAPLAGYASAEVNSLNDVGVAVGASQTLDANQQPIIQRGVRWDAGSGAPTALGELAGFTHTHPRAINVDGLIVGSAANYADDGTGFLAITTSRAVYWDQSGEAFDLNTLVDTASGWTLDTAEDVSDGRWITGNGTYDPDGAGGQDPYIRPYVLQLPYSGDFDDDGDVDGSDFLVWQRSVGTSDPAADANWDGMVNGADLAKYRQDYGQVMPDKRRVTATPEPASFVSALVAIVCGRAGCRRGLTQRR